MLPIFIQSDSGRFAAKTLGLAFFYVLTAKLGFLVAVPPGNVTLLWPPSGLALAVLMLWGYRACYGIALGAFCVNLWDMGYTMPLSTAACIAAGIACGSTVQTVVAATLLRRRIGPDLLLTNAATMIRFAAFAAVSCLIASTIGVICLDSGGLIARNAHAGVWSIWWLGDWMGMLVLAPLLLAIGRWLQKRPVEAGATISLIWSFGIGLSLLLFIIMWRLETQTIATLFEADARAANTAIQETVQFSIHHLDAISGLFVSSEEVTRGEFRLFVTALS